MSSFLDLPDELILKVFSYTETADILRCGQLSKRIRTISNDNSLFQTVNLSGKYVKTCFLETVLHKGCKSLNLSDSSIRGNLNLIQKSKLRDLDLSNCKTTTYVLEELFASCHSLQNLTLKGLQLNAKMVDSICQNSPTLEMLNLHNSEFEVVGHKQLRKICDLSFRISTCVCSYSTRSGKYGSADAKSIVVNLFFFESVA